jgi:hypothetical protein
MPPKEGAKTGCDDPYRLVQSGNYYKKLVPYVLLKYSMEPI